MSVIIEFPQELRVFLARELRFKESFSHSYFPNMSIKHLIESLGVPHTEIGEVRVNNKLVPLDYIVKDTDQVLVSAAKSNFVISDKPRFIVDNHAGKLARYLRMLGFDTVYKYSFDDAKLAEIAQNESRILITRDRRLLMRKNVIMGYWLRSSDPQQQIREVINRFRLKQYTGFFSRCIECNNILEDIQKEAIIDRLEPLTNIYFQEYRICTNCRRIYWKGGHYFRMRNVIIGWLNAD